MSDIQNSENPAKFSQSVVRTSMFISESKRLGFDRRQIRIQTSKSHAYRRLQTTKLHICLLTTNTAQSHTAIYTLFLLTTTSSFVHIYIYITYACVCIRLKYIYACLTSVSCTFLRVSYINGAITTCILLPCMIK